MEGVEEVSCQNYISIIYFVSRCSDVKLPVLVVITIVVNCLTYLL